MELEKIEGVVSDIVYANPDNGYTVFEVDTKDASVTAVGYVPYVTEGEFVVLSGTWAMHMEYGEQFKVELFERSVPDDADAILRYLSSGVIRGIRSATAEKIVDMFGSDTLNVLANFPDKLARVNGISKQRANEIVENYSKIRVMQETIITLQKYSLSPTLAIKAYNQLGENALDKIKENPYILCEQVDGIGFKTADMIAINMGISPNSVSRLRSAAVYFMNYAAQSSGHTYLPQAQLIQSLVTSLNVNEYEIENAVLSLISDGILKRIDTTEELSVALTSIYFCEISIAKRLNEMNNAEYEDLSEHIQRNIDAVQNQEKITLAPLQVEAVVTASKKGVIILTGGPGTGKTTTINAIIRVMQRNGKSVSLAAPTGRAAKRMSELTGMEAKTLHRLLEYQYSEDDKKLAFSRNENNPLDADVVIVDEMSMVDVFLADAFLRALKSGARLIMTGDADQLPSVGAGNVLKDIIDSETVTVIKLDRIFRQAEQSLIVTNAHRINHGEMPQLHVKDGDFFFLERKNARDIAKTISDLCTFRLPKSYGFDPIKDIQVLSPMKKSVIGVIALNALLQNSLNPPDIMKAEHKMGNILFREGDKVMQIKNNYDIEWTRTFDGYEGSGIYNGDIGYIESIDNDSRDLTVIFDDDKRVVYDFNSLDELELAYAVTVHKSQGSEFGAVIMPVFNAAPMLMCRNLFYTAVTRAKRIVILVGYESAIQTMVQNDVYKRRYTMLRENLENYK